MTDTADHPRDVHVPAGEARGVEVAAGSSLTVVCTAGSQVADVFAVSLRSDTEYLSVDHSRTAYSALWPPEGEPFLSNRFNPVLEVTRDTAGAHDAILAACTSDRYRALGVLGHRNCADNLRDALHRRGIHLGFTPQPINLFQSTPVDAAGNIEVRPSPARPGDEVTLRALIDLFVVVSSCPQDLTGLNGDAVGPLDLRLEGER